MQRARATALGPNPGLQATDGLDGTEPRTAVEWPRRAFVHGLLTICLTLLGRRTVFAVNPGSAILRCKVKWAPRSTAMMQHTAIDAMRASLPNCGVCLGLLSACAGRTMRPVPLRGWLAAQLK